MILDFTPHARKRMRERGVTEGEVVEALQAYEMSVPGQSSPICYIGTASSSGVRLQICLSGTLEEGASGARLKVVTVFKKN